MIKQKSSIGSISSTQPFLNSVYGLSRFCGFYFIAGFNAKLTRHGTPYWEVIIQDAFDTVAIYSDKLEPIIAKLTPYSPIQVECARRKRYDQYYFIADMVSPITEIPAKNRHVSLIPYSLLVDGYDLPRLLDCTSKISFAPLQHFVHSVLLQSKVMVPFIRNPASINFHHNILGGLLTHSLGVVDLIAKEFTHGTTEYDIAITAALLHDIGKTQTFSTSLNRTALGSVADHDSLTLEICAQPLSDLSNEHPHIANQLRHAWTCASPKARYGFTPQTRVAKQLQIADSLNAKVYQL